jgi:response regulator RpfG family c-di-GMP phosphodiesterase
MAVKMPDIDGIQAASAIRRMPFPACMTPIVATSATVRKEIESLCKSVGINDFVKVPVNEPIVTKILDRWLVRSASPSATYLNGCVLPRESKPSETCAHPSTPESHAHGSVMVS